MQQGIPDFTTTLFIGRPDHEKPLNGFERVRRYFNRYPGKPLIVVVRTPIDAEEVLLGVSALQLPEGCKFSVLVWDDDAKLLDTLTKMLGQLLFPKIFGMMWYECESKHETELSAEHPVKECATCKSKEITLIHPNEEEVKAFLEIMKKVVSLINFDTRSGESLTKIVNPTANALLNMPYAIKAKGPPPLESSDVFKTGFGKPAYLCAAGPSLEDAIPHLRRLQDTGIIVCVGRLYKLLRKEGIRVDYTVSCEMFDWDSAIFDDVGDVGDSIFVFPPVCAPATVQKWPGRRLCMWDMRTAEILGREDYTLGGNSVAHHLLNFAAEILQCEPMILIGQDLAYTKPTLHTHTGEQPAQWPQEIKEMDSTMQKEAWAECTGKEPFYPECHMQTMAAGSAAPIGPVMVRTSPSYIDFGTLFTILITRHGKRVYNTTPNGLKINGTEYLNLAEWDHSAWLLRQQAPPATPVHAPA